MALAVCVYQTGIGVIDMELDSYFVFLGEDDIRIKGTRVGIETVLEDYLDGASPEEIAARYRGLSLEQIYATITYYLHNPQQLDAYLEAWRLYTEQSYEEHQRNPSKTILKLRKLRQEQLETSERKAR
jgi:uncharacterized protein (DUF433 family)